MSNRLDIGIIASGYRPIRDGREYDSYFAGADDKDRIIIQDGDVDATVDLMKRVVWKYINDTKRIAKHLKGSSLLNTCENTWNFLYHHIQYKLDKKGLEQLRRPNRSWADRQSGIDCDCFSIFVSSILTNLQIPHSFRIARYNKNVFQHVYVIVPIPGTSNYYTIDCVLNQFNYEKPFTEKKDFPMNLNGINVAVLSGTDTTDVLDVVAGLDDIELLGTVSEAERSQAVYEHLVKTRNLVAQKPYLIAQVDYPPAFLKMLDYAIANWHTSNRTAALENLGRNEDELNRINGMDGVPDDTEFDGADEDWAHLEGLSAVEIQEELNGKTRRKEKRAAKKAARKANPKKAKKGFFRKVGQAVKKGVKTFVRFNPLTISARAGFLLAMKLNLKKMASKLKWGYATKEQAAAKGISTQQWERSKKALSKIEKLFADKLQGKKSALKNAILKGKAKGLSGFEDEEEIEILGLGFAPAAALAAAIPVITAALKIMVDSGVMKKGEAQNAEADVSAKTADAELVMSDQNAKEGGAETEIKAIKSSPSSPESDSDSTSSESSSPESSSSDSSNESNAEESSPAENIPDATYSEPGNEETTSSDSNIPNTTDPDTVIPDTDNPDTGDSDPGSSSDEGNEDASGESVDGIMGLVQKNPLLVIGGAVFGIWGLSKLFGGSKPSGKGLSGTPSNKRKKKKTPQHNKHKPKRNPKLKAITLS